MKFAQFAVPAVAALIVLAGGVASPARADSALDIGTKVPDAKAIKEGLFPEDACKELEANGFKCMGFKPAIRYSLPASSFQLGSADVPPSLKKQLDVFAEVLKSKKGSGSVVKIEGHADASGSADANLVLSQRRADAVKSYLVEQGVDASLLASVGVGTKDLKNASNPFSGENRRVEIGRQQ
ncbi:OmpA family protein [Aquabacterium sp.]|uniref:OmpA family protein n=1 Tax=Aquabacterium sp. TaxID=1872578 RepID=UPI0024880809|nr:OmpA family protein [Aquabacterium sp.]MDI1261211.1 OmpA family protein [Aquabacterium sp.]